MAIRHLEIGGLEGLADLALAIPEDPGGHEPVIVGELTGERWGEPDQERGDEVRHDDVERRVAAGDAAESRPDAPPEAVPASVGGRRLDRDGVEEDNLVWKDTVLVTTGQRVNILLEVSNPGRWMAHCHIAEHHESGMMFSFDVAPSS